MLNSSSNFLTLLLIIGQMWRSSTKHPHLLSSTHSRSEADFTLRLHTSQYVILYAGWRVVDSSMYHKVSHPQPDVIFIRGEIQHALHTFLLVLSVVCCSHCSWDVRGYSSNVLAKARLHTHIHTHTHQMNLSRCSCRSWCFCNQPLHTPLWGVSASVSTGKRTHSDHTSDCEGDLLIIELVIHLGLQVTHFFM